MGGALSGETEGAKSRLRDLVAYLDVKVVVEVEVGLGCALGAVEVDGGGGEGLLSRVEPGRRRGSRRGGSAALNTSADLIEI